MFDGFFLHLSRNGVVRQIAGRLWRVTRKIYQTPVYSVQSLKSPKRYEIRKLGTPGSGNVRIPWGRPGDGLTDT